MSHYSNLQFPYGIWCWACFHILVCHVYILIGEVSGSFPHFLISSFSHYWVLKCFLFILDNCPTSEISFCKYFLLLCDLPSVLLRLIFFYLLCFLLFYFVFGFSSKETKGKTNKCLGKDTHSVTWILKCPKMKIFPKSRVVYQMALTSPQCLLPFLWSTPKTKLHHR